MQQEHHIPTSLGREGIHSDDLSAEQRGIDYHLSLLEQLTQDIVRDPDVTEIEPGIMKAISVLHETFSEARKRSLPTPKDTSAAYQTSGANCPESSGSSSIPSMPALPPILDNWMERAAFTHPGVGNDHKATYDRLEILGDVYVELIATKVVWDKFPDISSGRISQIRETLVKNETLSEFASSYGLDRRASVPPNYSTQSKRWIKTKGDIFEAYVAAVILSDPARGYQTAEEWLSRLWLPMLDGLGHQKSELRSKETLAKKIMGKGIKLEYIEERTSIRLKGGKQTFFMGVYLTGWGWNKQHLGSGQGLSKAAAGDEAAREALLNAPLILEIIEAKRSKEGNCQ